MQRSAEPFLTARWLHLAMLNFEIDARVLAPYLPRQTEVDLWQGRALVSLVGFLFQDARLWNIGIPFHRKFEEVNLRFYVRRKTPEGWRRGVVFVRELAPRRAIEWGARLFYGENYLTVPMGHAIDVPSNGDGTPRRTTYWWRRAGRDYRIEAVASGQGYFAEPGSEAEFIVDQTWGYSGGPDRATIEYRVAHPPWTLWTCTTARFSGDVAGLYGQPFVEALTGPPRSAFLADGSAIELFKGRTI